MVDTHTITKTTLPDRFRTISRPRLIQQIRAAKTASVILVNGQPAQGKSTLAAEIARMDGPPCVWMHLDPSEQDPVNLFRLLVHALKSALPGEDVSAFLRNPSMASGPRATPERIAELAGAFLDEIATRTPVRIVMDGLDVLAQQPATLAVVERIRRSVSPPGRLVLVSREALPLKLETMRIRRELIELTNDDLAFTPDEILHFFKALYGVVLNSSQAQQIQLITDGWAGGLILVWEALRHVPEAQRNAFIGSGLPAALKGERLAYFSETVFSGLDAGLQSFLIRSAIFDTIDTRMMARYMGGCSEKEAHTIFHTLVRQNRFIQPLYDPQTGRGYRYNQLFRDFLRDKFNDTLDRPTRCRHYMKAANLAWNDGNHENAIRFFLQAGSYEKAAAGIKKIAMGLSAQGRFADLAAWIDRLPETLIEDDAWLVFYKAVAYRISGGRRNIAAFSGALDRFAAENDPRGQLLASAYLIETAVFIGHPATDLNRWLKSAWLLLESVSNNRYYAFAKTILWMQVAFGYLTVAGNIQQGLSACRNALLMANTIGDDTLTVNITIVHVFGLTLAGEFAAAEKALASVDRLTEAAYPEYRALKNIVRVELAMGRGELDEAQRLLTANQQNIDKFGLLFLYPIHVDLSGMLFIHRYRYDELTRTAQHLRDVATLAANPFYEGLAMRLQALGAYHQGRYNRARRWSQQAVDIIARSEGQSIHLYRCRLIAGMAAYHLGDLPQALETMVSVKTFFVRVSSHLTLVEARLGLSLIEMAIGNDAAADRHRESALSLAAAQGYESFPLLSAPDVEAACTPAIRSDRSRCARLARRILGRLPGGGVKAPETGHTAIILPPLPDGSAWLDIRTLGGFEVRHNGKTAISDRQWAGVRQKLLLKAIVVNGCREIPKDILMDALWPDSSTDTALKRFKVTLHRLRNVLESDTDRRSGASCIALKDNRVSLDMKRCRVDVDDFLAACDAIRHLKRGGDDDRCLAACQRAVSIYAGEFLPEEPYLNRVEMKRTALREQFLGVLMDMAAIFEAKGKPDQAIRCGYQAIQADPLAEYAYLQLMHLLQRQGRRSAALRVYRDLERRLADELDTEPDPETTRMYEKICELKAEG